MESALIFFFFKLLADSNKFKYDDEIIRNFDSF